MWGYKERLRDFEYKSFNMKSCMTLLGHSNNMKSINNIYTRLIYKTLYHVTEQNK